VTFNPPIFLQINTVPQLYYLLHLRRVVQSKFYLFVVRVFVPQEIERQKVGHDKLNLKGVFYSRINHNIYNDEPTQYFMRVR
jgi:hypothetical protein